MAFFLIIPAWFFCALVGIVLLCMQRSRRTGLYMVNISTAASITSILLSTAVLFVGTRIGLQRAGQWARVALILAYALAIGAGAAIGAVAGLLLTRKLLHRR